MCRLLVIKITLVTTLTTFPDCSQYWIQYFNLQKEIQYTDTIEVATRKQGRKGTQDKQYSIERTKTQQ